jgi:hypothetical protein
VDAVLASDLAGLGLIQPLPIVGLLAGRGGLVFSQRGEHRRAPRVDLRVEGAGSHAIPFTVDHKPGVTHQLTSELAADLGGQPLGRLDLLGDGQRLGLGPRPRGVVALEAEEDQETQQHGEPCRQHPEHTRRPVAVVVVATLRGPAPGHQHGGDGERRHDDNDQRRPQDVHQVIASTPAGQAVTAPPASGRSGSSDSARRAPDRSNCCRRPDPRASTRVPPRELPLSSVALSLVE